MRRVIALLLVVVLVVRANPMPYEEGAEGAEGGAPEPSVQIQQLKISGGGPVDIKQEMKEGCCEEGEEGEDMMGEDQGGEEGGMF